MAREPEPKVIVGVDNSYGSFEALRVAAQEARERGLPLEIVHVIGWIGADGSWEAARERGHQLIKDCIGDALGRRPTDLRVIRTVVERAAPGPGLVHVANADSLIVVGARMTRHVWRSGVDTYLVRNAPCRVLTVPAPQLLREIRTSRRARRDWRRSVDQLAAIAAGE
jgi:nucleotide-binding universal stress UspA family protein